MLGQRSSVESRLPPKIARAPGGFFDHLVRLGRTKPLPFLILLQNQSPFLWFEEVCVLDPGYGRDLDLQAWIGRIAAAGRDGKGELRGVGKMGSRRCREPV